MPRVTLTGSLDSLHGYSINIHQDHDGVRINVGAIEIMLDVPTSVALRDLLQTAETEAILWRVSQDA